MRPNALSCACVYADAQVIELAARYAQRGLYIVNSIKLACKTVVMQGAWI